MESLVIFITFLNLGLVLLLISTKINNTKKDNRPKQCRKCNDEYGNCYRCSIAEGYWRSVK